MPKRAIPILCVIGLIPALTGCGLMLAGMLLSQCWPMLTARGQQV